MSYNNLISLKGAAYEAVKKALRQWVHLYAERLESHQRTELYNMGRAKQLIHTPGLPSDLFCFLVNYLVYPEDSVYKANAEGILTIQDEALFPRQLQGQRVLLFIPDTDKDYDNVYGVTQQDEVFKIDFGGKLSWQGSLRRFLEPIYDLSNLPSPEIVQISRIKASLAILKNGERRLSKRFKIGAIIILSLLPIGFIITRENPNRAFASFIPALITYGWLMTDYKLLRSNKYYIRCLLLTLVILLHGVFMTRLYDDDAVLYFNGIPFYFCLLNGLCAISLSY